ncbi:MAG: hypothetical protein LLF95_11255 [Bacteroidales bacterium]|nr:hypothetical protein [Bacteroidales bacterium]
MFRIKSYPNGFVVEIQKTKWYGKKYWTHAISVAGMPHRPWYFSSFSYALENLLHTIELEVIRTKE